MYAPLLLTRHDLAALAEVAGTKLPFPTEGLEPSSREHSILRLMALGVLDSDQNLSDDGLSLVTTLTGADLYAQAFVFLEPTKFSVRQLACTAEQTVVYTTTETSSIFFVLHTKDLLELLLGWGGIDKATPASVGSPISVVIESSDPHDAVESFETPIVASCSIRWISRNSNDENGFKWVTLQSGEVWQAETTEADRVALTRVGAKSLAESLHKQLNAAFAGPNTRSDNAASGDPARQR